MMSQATDSNPPPAGGDLFEPDQTFGNLGLDDRVLQGLTEAGFEKPTQIQARLIPLILRGRDVLGQARTGTGKTAAFALPLLHLADPDVDQQALILTPTRELASQVAAEIGQLGQFTSIRTACIVGGESMRQQQKQIQQGAHLLVGTPGRVMDMLGRHQIHFRNLRRVVLDEVDRMLDIGFRDDIKRILKQIPTHPQTTFCSATIDEPIEQLGRQFLDPQAEKVVTVSGSLTVSMVQQKHLPVEPWDKRALLLHLLRHEKPDTTLVFCRTKATVHKISQYLREKGVEAREIHGDMHQSKRTKVMNSMRQGKLDVLVASDLAARGLDVEHISHVINYDLPDDPEIYIHRIGRTARAGREGIAWSFVTPEQGQLLTEIEKLTGVLIEKMEYPDFKPGAVPEDVQQERQRERQHREGPTSHAERAASRTQRQDLEGLSEQEIQQMFPGGKVPKSAPKKTLGSKLRSRR